MRISILAALSVISLVVFACSTDDSCRGDACNDSGQQSTMDSSAECPIDAPEEGDPCTEPGRVCPAVGTISCPNHATCDSTGVWRIGCPLAAFGTDAPCSCPHPGE